MEGQEKKYNPNPYVREKLPDEILKQQSREIEEEIEPDIVQEQQDQSVSKKPKRPVFKRVIYLLLFVVIGITMHAGLLQSLKVRTGFDAGLGWRPLVKIQDTFHYKIDPKDRLMSYGYLDGDRVPQGESADVEYGDLIIGDVLLLDDNYTVVSSLYDRDFSMDTCSMVWVDEQSCRVRAVINPAYILHGISEEKSLEIRGKMLEVYNYQHIWLRYLSTGELLKGWSE